LGEAESERDNLLVIRDKMEATQRRLTDMEEREQLLLKDIDDTKAKHAFAQAEFEQERDELNDVVTKSKILLQEKMDEFTMQKRAYDQIVSENRELNSYKRSVLILEQEKRELECKINTYRYIIITKISRNNFRSNHATLKNPDPGRILLLRILYHIPYHGQKSDIISYPISRQNIRKGYISYILSNFILASKTRNSYN
jgi:hypothetical protein